MKEILQTGKEMIFLVLLYFHGGTLSFGTYAKFSKKLTLLPIKLSVKLLFG